MRIEEVALGFETAAPPPSSVFCFLIAPPLVVVSFLPSSSGDASFSAISSSLPPRRFFFFRQPTAHFADLANPTRSPSLSSPSLPSSSLPSPAAMVSSVDGRINSTRPPSSSAPFPRRRDPHYVPRSSSSFRRSASRRALPLIVALRARFETPSPLRRVHCRFWLRAPPPSSSPWRASLFSSPLATSSHALSSSPPSMETNPTLDGGVNAIPEPRWTVFSGVSSWVVDCRSVVICAPTDRP
ncbi:unnamed protein product [Linum trigynum]|uniref:Uncharacterized protein n=1 Tax=Linum trigynum TaxID=586398 RepID=A0AAV2CB45_9ROSI